MTLNAQQTALVYESYRIIDADIAALAEIFYPYLFEIAPDTEPLFRGDSKLQRTSLAQTIGTLVATLVIPTQATPSIQHMGKRHVTYNVRREHYDAFEEALFLAFEQILGDAFTPEVREAWQILYEEVTRIATDAAY